METRRLPDGTVTLLFTDIEGSTRLLQELGSEAYVDALTTHRRLLRDALTSHGGVEVEMQGDSFHFAFHSARDAVAAAAAGQRALQEYEWELQPIRVRMGLHTGEPMQADGLYAGLDVHRAARIMSSGHGGQILLSHRTAELVSGEAAGVDVVDLGEHRLKDLTAPQRLYQVGGAHFPPLETLSVRTNLPVAASPLIGREAELADLTRLLVGPARVVTVTGPGGVGKTRLALQAAGEVVELFPGGLHWIPLAGLTDPALVLPTIETALGIADRLAFDLAERRALLVLDNFEHVLGAAAPVAGLLAARRELDALVTSRSPLQIEGEQEYPLDSLSEADAITLFVERSRATGRPFSATPTVTRICRRLDNLPLAIELAAARTKVLGPDALLGRLEHRLPLLTGGRRDVPERQRTLRATIDWSYELLDESAQNLFARLSIFAGDFSLDAAEAICSADLDQLQALVDLSLLEPAGEDRFVMLGTIREYAEELFQERSDAEEVRRRRTEWFAALFDDWAPHYDAGVADREDFPFSGYREVVEAAVVSVLATRPARVLELGVGTGNVTAALLARRPEIEVYGLDFSQRMLALAREKAPHARLISGDLLQLAELELPRFDAVVAAYVLHEFDEERKEWLVEHLMRERVRSSGLVVIADIAFKTRKEHDEARRAAMHRWDDAEHYFVADEFVQRMLARGIAADYRQVTRFAGMFELRTRG